MIDPFEIQPGLALFLDPTLLVQNGARCTSTYWHVRSPHYFICTAVRGRESDWMATSSRPGPGRVIAGRRWGHLQWVAMDTYADIYEVWTAEAWVVRIASVVDRSMRTQRNFASLDFLYDEECAAA